MSRRLAPLGAALALLLGAPAAGHEVRPAFLELRDLGGDTFEIVWRVPARGDLRLGLEIGLPEGCRDLGPRRAGFVSEMHEERWQTRCPGGLAGQRISVEGLSRTVIDVIVRVVRADGATQTARILPSDPSLVVDAEPGPLQVARTYLGLGIEHILLGTDHLLFVLGLLILVRGARQVAATITAFTVSHSLALAAATLGLVQVPPRPVEAAIALSIVFLAREIVRSRSVGAEPSPRRPWVMAFGFGLLHGVGFAGALGRLGMPAGAVPVALLFFNVGVEVGQVLFIAAAFAVAAGLRSVPSLRAGWASPLPAYAIGSVACFWMLQRIAAFWG
jgi:hydrogenase/urease accessory protein HupE